MQGFDGNFQGMPVGQISIVDVDSEPPWADIAESLEPSDHADLTRYAIVREGMGSGATSIAIAFPLPGGRWASVGTSLALLESVVVAARGAEHRWAERTRHRPRSGTGVTTDRADPRLRRGSDQEPVEQAEVYLVLSEEERAKGFVRPYRETYRHVAEVHADGTAGCGQTTTMAAAIAETYARKPDFYGGTYCTTCRMHRPLAEFVWLDGTAVGS